MVDQIDSAKEKTEEKPCNTRCNWPLFAPHPTLLHTCVPAVTKVARSTDPMCPSKVRMQVPSGRDHILMVLSPEEVSRA